MFIKYKNLATLALFSIYTLTSFSAWGVTQVLDRVDAFDKTSVLGMKFDDPAPRAQDFDVLINSPGSDFKACKLSATNGAYCLVGDEVINWPTGTTAGGSNIIADCKDQAFKAKSCTGMTVDLAGNIWLAVRNKGKTHNLFKLQKKDADGSCLATNNANYCATLWSEDKPLLLDLNSVDGDTATDFTGFGKSVVGLEERKTAVVFLDDGDDETVNTVITVASGKRDWGLAGNEQLQSIALLQVENPGTSAIENYLLVTTSKDRIILAETDGTPDTREVFDIAGQRDSSATQCNFDNAYYGIRTSPKSGLTYVTDKQYCQVLALLPAFDAGNNLIGLINAPEGSSDLTLSTNGTLGTFPVLGPTVAPGASIDLSECGAGESCTLVAGTSNGATMSNVTTIPGSKTGMTLFLIEGLPDCRLIPGACVALLDNIDSEADLVTENIIIDRQGSGDPAAQLLNVTPLLPREVTEPFAGTLPPLWISQQYQAQLESPKSGFFTAMFGITDANFSGVFDIEVEVAELAGGYQRGCRTGDPVNTPALTLIGGYDVAVKVSEGFVSINRDYINGNNDHEVMLTNTGCGSSRMSGSRWSLWAFDLGFSPDTYDGINIAENDSAVFFKLLVSLYDDLEQSVNQLACIAADGQSNAPLATADCNAFSSALYNTRDKLDKCMSATLEPKNSSRSQNCQAYLSQYANLESTVADFSLAGEDPANRIGQTSVQMLVIDNVYTHLFFPSIPDAGFNPQ